MTQDLPSNVDLCSFLAATLNSLRYCALVDCVDVYKGL